MSFQQLLSLKSYESLTENQEAYLNAQFQAEDDKAQENKDCITKIEQTALGLLQLVETLKKSTQVSKQEISLNQEMEKMKKQEDQLRAYIIEQEKTNKQLIEEVTNLNNKISKSEQQIMEARSTIQNLLIKNTTLLRQLEKAQIDIIETQERKNQKEEALKQTLLMMADYKLKLKNKTEAYMKQEKELEEAHRKNMQVTIENFNHEETIDELRSQLKSMNRSPSLQNLDQNFSLNQNNKVQLNLMEIVTDQQQKNSSDDDVQPLPQKKKQTFKKKNENISSHIKRNHSQNLSPPSRKTHKRPNQLDSKHWNPVGSISNELIQDVGVRKSFQSGLHLTPQTRTSKEQFSGHFFVRNMSMKVVEQSTSFKLK